MHYLIYVNFQAFQNVNAIDVVKKGCSKGQGILKLEELINDETAGRDAPGL